MAAGHDPPTVDAAAEPASSLAVPDADSPLGWGILVVSLLFAGLTLLQIYRVQFLTERFVNFHLALGFLLFFLVYLYRRPGIQRWSRREWALTAGLTALTAMVLVSTGYIELHMEQLRLSRITGFTRFEVYAIALPLVVASVAAMYYAYGPVLPAMAVLALLYARFGYLVPGVLYHNGLAWERIVTYNTLQLEGGVFSIIVQISAKWVFVFLLWAGVVREFGGVEAFMEIGFLISRRFRSGAAQIAVVSSLLMGSISGSPMANSVVTGSFTIPLMKRRGLSGTTAGAIESVASTGGMIMPPVMGSVAFLMAAFLNRSYGEIVVAGLFPALIFYVAVAVSVHLVVLDEGVDVRLDRDVDRRELGLTLVPIVASLAALIYFLLVEQLPPGAAGLRTIGVIVAAKLLQDVAIDGPGVGVLEGVVRDTANGLKTGSVTMASFTVTFAGIGVLISSFGLTSIGYRLSSAIVSLAGGSTLLLLLVIMATSIFLGMGVPTVAAYLLVITLVAPAMVQVGFEEITAHFFVFYYAMLAAITPPIALVCTVTSTIAEEDFLAVAVRSAVLGIPLFLVPLLFAFNESLLGFEGVDTLVALAFATLGTVALVVGIHGRSARGTGVRGSALRVGLIGAGLLVSFLPFIVSVAVV